MSIFKGDVIVTNGFVNQTPKGVDWRYEASIQAATQCLRQLPPDLLMTLFNITELNKDSEQGKEILDLLRGPDMKAIRDIKRDCLTILEASFNIREKTEGIELKVEKSDKE